MQSGNTIHALQGSGRKFLRLSTFGGGVTLCIRIREVKSSDSSDSQVRLFAFMQVLFSDNFITFHAIRCSRIFLCCVMYGVACRNVLFVLQSECTSASVCRDHTDAMCVISVGSRHQYLSTFTTDTTGFCAVFNFPHSSRCNFSSWSFDQWPDFRLPNTRVFGWGFWCLEAPLAEVRLDMWLY